MLKLLKPHAMDTAHEAAYMEFMKYHRLITGRDIPVDTADDGKSDYVLIGTDAVNHFTAEVFLSGEFAGFPIRYGSEDYAIRGVRMRGRSFLFIGGGRGRAVLYAVYTYLEKVCGCRWFWDGDRVPEKNALLIDGIDIVERPKLSYRGLRYFAHRGLWRFQAEHWGWEDWKREIDWMLKKRLNLFMLRIGHDDIFQKAFPESCQYPPEDDFQSPGKKMFYDRTSAWGLRYRGELRKKVLSYAFDRDLMHPEDCGTMTHWYTPTPLDFIENEKPEFFDQATANYGDPEQLCWDIRKDKWLQKYFSITEAHIREYGRPQLFHTIGFAERMFSEDRAVNMRMKQYVYRRIGEYVRKNYPNAPLMIASWDLWFKYTPEEAAKLLEEFDPDSTILLDYTSDSKKDNNFTKWGTIGKFPYIFGIFHAYSRNNDVRGDYAITEERLKIAAADKMCRGLIYWPEVSHSDTFMSEYFTSNAWSPLELTMEERIEKYAKDRYAYDTEKLTEVYKAFQPFVEMQDWWSYSEFFFNPILMMTYIEQEMAIRCEKPERLAKMAEDAAWILETLATIDLTDDMIRRDAYDIARTLIGRYIHVAQGDVIARMIDWKNGKDCEVLPLYQKAAALLEILCQVLAGHDDYSLVASLKRLQEEHPVNPVFEHTLKENATCEYHRAYVYENMKYLYLPETAIVGKWLALSFEKGDHSLPDSSSYKEMAVKNKECFFALPFAEMDRAAPAFPVLMQEAADNIRKLWK